MPSSISSTDDLDGVSIAVDFGGTKISAVRISKNEIIDRRRVETDQDAPPEAHLDTIVGLIKELGEGRNAHLGVAVCGRIDYLGNWHSLNNDTLKGFSSFPLRDQLEVRLGSPVNVMNDATAAAWGEFSVCAEEQQVDSMLYITVSTGVGGGIVLNRRPLISADGLAGHIGFVSSSFGTERCGSGRLGTLESVASGTAIGRAASEAGGDPLTGYDVFQAHLSNDVDATTIVDRSARAISKVIADVRALLGINLVSIGGGVGLAEGYIAMIEQHLNEEPALFRPRVLAARLGADSALFGVAIPENND